MNEYVCGDISVKQYSWEIVDSNSFLLTSNGKALLVDAIDSSVLYSELVKYQELLIILTHSHFDHICGLNHIRSQNQNAIVCATKQCSINIGNKYKNLSSVANTYMTFYEGNPFSGDIKPIICAPAELTFEKETTIDWNGHSIMLKAVHGHSNDSLVAILDDSYLFSGDSLLAMPTVTRFPGGSTEKFRNEDLPYFEGLDIKTVFPGHGLPGNVDRMLKVNALAYKGV